MFPSPLPPRPCTRSGSPTIRPTEWRGFSEAYGSWKIICIRWRSGRSSFSPMWVMSVPSKTILPPVGSYRRSRARPTVDLPQPGLADEPERLAAFDQERDAVDRLHVADVAVHHDSAPDREPDAEVVDLDERVAHCCPAQPGALPLVRRHRVEATDVVTGLELLEQRHLLARQLDLVAAARGERALARRAQHVSRRAGDRLQLLAPPGVDPRHALEQAERVGVPRLREEAVGAAGLHEHAGVHHVARARTCRRRRRGRG